MAPAATIVAAVEAPADPTGALVRPGENRPEPGASTAFVRGVGASFLFAAMVRMMPAEEGSEFAPIGFIGGTGPFAMLAHAQVGNEV